MKKLKLLIQIYITFLKLGSMSFGGGYAILSLMEREVVEGKKWVKREVITDIFAVSQSLPGAIALNASAFVGFSIAGVPGAIAALLGNLTSPVIIVMILSLLYMKFKDISAVQSAFRGIYPAIIGLILYAAYKIGKTAVKGKTGITIMLCAFILATFAQIPPIPLIISGAGIGLFISKLKNGLDTKKTISIIVGLCGILIIVITFIFAILFQLQSNTLLMVIILLSLLVPGILTNLPGSGIKTCKGDDGNETTG